VIKKMFMLSLFLIFTMKSPSIFGQQKCFFGVMRIQNENAAFGTLFLGEYQSEFIESKFEKINNPQKNIENIEVQVKKVLKNFEVNKLYPGLDAYGTPSFINLTEEGSEAASEYTVAFTGISTKNKKLPIFFWTSKDLSLQPIKAKKIVFSEKDQIPFKVKIKDVLEKATSSKNKPKYDYKLKNILSPVVLKPEDSSEFITMVFPLTLEYSLSRSGSEKEIDSDGFFFFIYNTKTKKIISSRFGHPEWNLYATEIKVIKPVLFFSLAGKTYFFSEYYGPWEYTGYAIFELETGKKVLETY